MAGSGNVGPPHSRRPIRLLSSRVHGRAATATAALRILTGLAFVLFSLPKFVRHEDELAEFVRYGLPDSSAIVYLVGTLELAAGLMLVLGVATRWPLWGWRRTWLVPSRPPGPRWAGCSTSASHRCCCSRWCICSGRGPVPRAIDRTLSERLAPTPGRGRDITQQ